MTDSPLSSHICTVQSIEHFILDFMFSMPTTGVIIGFPFGETFNVTEGNEGAITMCSEILEGVLERDVSIFASTSDITAIGTATA